MRYSGIVMRESKVRAFLGIEGLAVDRGGRNILSDISFEARRGEILCVIGANGAGKTTLLEAIVGFVPSRSGAVLFEGVPLHGIRAQSKVFSFMPDDAEPPAELRVRSLASHARRWGGAGAALGDDLYRALDLESFEHAFCGDLSRGEKRRLQLFCALATARPVVMLDEPLGTFDPLQLRSVLEVLRASARAGATLILSVHQMADAEKIADRVLLLHRGRVLAIGALADLRGRAGAPDGSLEQVFMRFLEARS